ncbi:hypothetical protein BASA61_002972 [Batrachochytrium salamandrivorans]|nr:hypothetical protein BASA61_002972 [Batrachochytrium salamandrivorans]
MSASRHLHDEDGSSSMKDTAKGSTQGSVPDYLLPGFEPSRATISQLCSALAAHNIPLPGSRQLKSVYVDLFERNLTIETRRAWVEQMQLVQPCAEGIVQVGSDGRSETLLHADSTPPRPSSISSPATPTAHAATVSAKTNLLRLLPIAGGQAKTLPKKRPASSDTTHGSSSSSNGNGSSIGNNTSGSIATKATPLLPRRVSFSSNKENAVDQVSDSPSARDRLASTMHSASALLRKISVPRRRPQNASTTTTTTTTISSTSNSVPGGDTLTTTLTTEIPTTHGWSESMLGAESESGTTEHNKMEAADASDVASTTTTTAPSLFYHHNSIYDSLDDSISSTLHDDHKEDVLHKRTRTCPDQTDRPPSTLNPVYSRSTFDKAAPTHDTTTHAFRPSLASPARNITPTKIHVFGRSSPSCLSSSSSINLHSNSSVSSIDLASNDKLATNNDSSNINYNYHYSTTTTTATTAAPRYRNSPASKSPKSIYRRATSPTKTSTAATTFSQDNGTAPYRSKFYIDPYMPGVRSRVGGSAVHTNQTPLIHADSLFPDSVMLDSETNEDHHAPPKKVSELTAEWTRKIELVSNASNSTATLSSIQTKNHPSPFAISAERVSARSVYPDPITSGQSDSLRTPKEAAKEIDDDSTVAEPDEGMSLYSDEVVETWESEKDGETKGSDSLYSKAASVSASTGTWWSFLLLFTCNINYNYHYSTTTTTATTAAPRYRNSPASKSPKSIYRRATSPTKTSTAATTFSQDNGTAPYRSKFYIDPYMPGVRSRVGGSAVHTNQTPLIHADSLFPDSVMLDSETNEDHHTPPKKVSELTAEWTRKIELVSNASNSTATLSSIQTKNHPSPFAISAERVSARSVYPDPITSGQSDSLRTPKEAAKEIDDDSTVAEPDEGMSLYSDEVVETWESEKDGETKGSDSLYSKAASVSASTGTWWSFLLLFTCVMMVVVSIVAAGVYWQELNELVQMPFNEHHPAHALYVKMAHMYDHHSQIVVDHTLQVMGVIRDYTMDIALAIYALIGKYYAMGCRTAEDSAAVVIAYFQETTAALPIYTEKISAAATSLYAHASEVVAQSPWLVSLGVNLRVMATLIVREHLKLMHEVLAWGLALWSSLDLSTMHAILAEGARMTDIAVKQIADVSALVLDPVMEMVHSVLKG